MTPTYQRSDSSDNQKTKRPTQQPVKKRIEGVREAINTKEEIGDKLRGNKCSWTSTLEEPFGPTSHRPICVW